MEWGTFFRREETGAEERYLALKLSAKKVLAALAKISAGRLEISPVSEGEINFSRFSDFVSGADKAVSEVLDGAQLPVVKTIFGIPPGWVAEGKIVTEKLDFLRRACRELDLRPLGYVLLPEALENFYKEKEGAPLTAILVGVDGADSWVTVYRAGKSLGTKVLENASVSPAEVCPAIEKTLKHFPQVEVLPARLILYNGPGDLSLLAEKATAYPWTRELPFLHVPKVETLSAGEVVEAIVVAGGQQISGKKIEEIALPEKAPVPEEENQKEEDSEKSEEEISAAEIGFTTPRSFGQLEEIPTSLPAAKKTETAKKTLFSKVNLSLRSFFPLVAQMGRRIIALKDKWPGTRIPVGNLGLAAAACLAVFVLLGLAVYYLPQARLIVKLSSRPFTRELELTVAGQFVQTTESGTKKGVATGRKLVGEKARGAVTIYSAAAGRTLAAGTTLTASSGQKFLLDSDATVASGSGVAAQTTTNAQITAGDIGENYNLPAGTLFTLENLPATSYQAKNADLLAGGTSRQATVVTKEDQNRLVATLSAELADRAAGILNERLSSGQTLLPNAITSAVSQKKFSKDIDAEAETVSLDLTMDFKGITVSQEELINQFASRFAREIPAGYHLDRPGAKVEIISAKTKEKNAATLKTKLLSRLLPDVSAEEIARSVAGKGIEKARQELTRRESIKELEVEARPRVAERLFRIALPWRPKNLTVELVSD